MKKQYVVSRGHDRRVSCKVIDGNLSYPLAHANIHSPDGFECGYGGSGPSDLAASILAEHYEVSTSVLEDTAHGKRDNALSKEILRMHQDFKIAFVAPIVIDEGEEAIIRDEDISDWVVQHSVKQFKMERAG